MKKINKNFIRKEKKKYMIKGDRIVDIKIYDNDTKARVVTISKHHKIHIYLITSDENNIKIYFNILDWNIDETLKNLIVIYHIEKEKQKMKHFKIYDAPFNEENVKEAERVIEFVYEKYGLTAQDGRFRITTYVDSRIKKLQSRLVIEFLGTEKEYNYLCEQWEREER